MSVNLGTTEGGAIPDGNSATPHGIDLDCSSEDTRKRLTYLFDCPSHASIKDNERKICIKSNSALSKNKLRLGSLDKTC
jgi:hypothetical protein